MKPNRHIIRLLVIGVFATLMAGLTSCKGVKFQDADEAYERGEYFNAANMYRKLYNKYNQRDDRWIRGELAFHLGMCYEKLNQSSRAAAAFQNAIRYEYEDSTTLYHLALAQQREGRYAEAIENYEAFLRIVPDHWQSKQGIIGCRQAPKWKEQGSRYIVKSAKQFNSRRADFCPMFLDKEADQLYFTSSTTKATGDTLSLITGTKRSDIFYSKIDDKGKWTRPEPAGGELNSDQDEGVTAFTPDGSMMYFAKAIRKNAPSTVEIYTSTRSEAKWSAPQRFEITGDTLSAYGDPAVSADGNWLYFSSDIPGGQGGLDLWRINIKDKRGTLENLGDQLNTPGNERFPYCRTDSLIYFASDGHAGMGGLDLFRATLQPSGKWFVENMGSPMNSAYDDFGITYGKGESGFFSSNRGDARGYDHIFSFERPELKVWISGYVLDKDDEPVPNAVIRIVGDDGSNQKAAGKPDGSFRFDLERGVNYVMLAGAQGYLNSKQQFRSDDEEADAEYNVDFILSAIFKPQVIEEIFYDYDKAALRDESKRALDEMVKVLQDNPKIKIEMGSHTDRFGSDHYNNGLSMRRAQSVVDYLVAAGIDRKRLVPHGYGKTRPMTVTKHVAKQYPQFKEGDVLSEDFIANLREGDQAAADQINRRTTFQVLSTDFELY